MDQLKVFIAEKFIETNNKNEVVTRHEMFDSYYYWFTKENIIIEAIYLNEEKWRCSTSPVLRYNKKIGRLEFYKLLIEIYGKPPLKNRYTKQYSYYFKKL